MRKFFALFFVILLTRDCFSQRILTAWSQQNIENYTREMYDAAQKLTPAELLEKNRNDTYWSEVFLTLNASVNNYKSDQAYQKELARQLTDTKETKLLGTSRLIIWERIITGEILFEGKGLVMDNDLFKVAGRSNQLLQNLTNKNFGNVGLHTSPAELETLKNKWLDYLSGKPAEEYKFPEYTNAKIPEISSLTAVQALIVSLQDNHPKELITKNCLKKVYNLDEMPADKSSSAQFCNPDTYTYSYLAMLFADLPAGQSRDAKWWKEFWETKLDKMSWNSEKGYYEVKQ